MSSYKTLMTNAKTNHFGRNNKRSNIIRLMVIVIVETKQIYRLLHERLNLSLITVVDKLAALN